MVHGLHIVTQNKTKKLLVIVLSVTGREVWGNVGGGRINV
jgi:hypothetical protein